MSKKLEIPAIHDKNLKQILDDFGISKKIDANEAFCINCSDHITWDNIAGLKILNKEPKIICANPECLATMTNETQSNG
jgi:hypothetical protein